MTVPKLLTFTLVKESTSDGPIDRMLGVISNDSRFAEGHRIYTSGVVCEYYSDGKKYAETETGTIYELGVELCNLDFYAAESEKGSSSAITTMRDLLGIVLCTNPSAYK